MILTLRFLNRKVIDIREPQTHETIVVEFPILIREGAKPVSQVIVPFVGEAHGDAIARKCPKLFDQSVVQFFCPFAGKKRDDFLPAIHEFRTVSPLGARRVGQSYFFRIARIPGIFRQANLQHGSFMGERWQRGPGMN